MSLKNKGKCVIFSAPSGAGKTTIVHHLLKQNIGLEFSVSACSREPRPGETDGRDYHFLGIDKFTYAGHSMGGGIGYVLGLNYAARLTRLILMAPIPAAGIPGEPNQDMMKPRMQARLDGNRDFFKTEMIASRFREDVETDAWFESRIDHLMRVSEGHVLGGMQTMHDLNVEDQLAELKTPTLMLAGAVDSLLAANLNDYSKLPDATLHVFSRAGHDVAVHEPDGVSDAIDQFMQHGPMSAAKIMSRLQ